MTEGNIFQARGHSFSLYGPTRHVYIFSCSKLALQITNGFVYATLSLLNPLARPLLTICKKLRNKRVIQIPDKDVLKKRYFSIYFMIVVFISPGKFSNVKFCAKREVFFTKTISVSRCVENHFIRATKHFFPCLHSLI